jgi:hypothetical protein
MTRLIWSQCLFKWIHRFYRCTSDQIHSFFCSQKTLAISFQDMETRKSSWVCLPNEWVHATPQIYWFVLWASTLCPKPVSRKGRLFPRVYHSVCLTCKMSLGTFLNSNICNRTGHLGLAQLNFFSGSMSEHTLKWWQFKETIFTHS